jgi:2-oxoglutarate ferredoxin oxidoreductase subunit gamma
MKDSTRFEIRIAGFGGQGIVTIGKVLGHAFSILEGVNSVNTRSYGPESRGGACRSELVVAQGEIHYPGVRSADILVALSQTALDAYIGDLKTGGILLMDPHSVSDIPTTVNAFEVPAMEIANAVGSVKFQNAAALGALAALLSARIKKESIAHAVCDHVPPKTRKKNMDAFERGWAHVRAAVTARE